MSDIHKEAWERVKAEVASANERHRLQRKANSLLPGYRPSWMFEVVYGSAKSVKLGPRALIRAGRDEKEAAARVGVGDAWLGGRASTIRPLPYVCIVCLYGTCECKESP